jgi:hypothetical protein
VNNNADVGKPVGCSTPLAVVGKSDLVAALTLNKINIVNNSDCKHGKISRPRDVARKLERWLHQQA